VIISMKTVRSPGLFSVWGNPHKRALAFFLVFDRWQSILRASKIASDLCLRASGARQISSQDR